MTHFKIVDGPGKWDFAVALFDEGYDHRKVAMFHLEDPESSQPVKKSEPMIIPFLINAVEREDGSGNNWIFTGRYGPRTAKGFYSIKTRKGWVEMER